MAAKSDFAQKLLHDLRLRKERMAATQNSSKPNLTSRGAHGNPGPAYKGSRQIKALESVGSRSGNSIRKTSGTRAFQTRDSSNQIVLYGQGRSPEQIGDLSTALALAFGNGGKFNKMDASSSNQMLNFLHQIGRRSLDTGRIEIRTNITKNGSTPQFPTFSHVHIHEVSKGVQKLNQILKACSNGLNFGRYSVEVGKELLRGAMDLEESLRMLVNLQEASDYMVNSQRKNRIKLLEEDEDDENEIAIANDLKQLDRPRFSFDKPSRNSQRTKDAAQNDIKQQLMALTYPEETPQLQEHQPRSRSNSFSHTRSTSCVSDLKTLSTYLGPKGHSISHSKPEKVRISNVIAKLMGLEELPPKEESKVTLKEMSSNKKEKTVSEKSPIPVGSESQDTGNGAPVTANRNVSSSKRSPARDARFMLHADNSQVIPNGSSRVVISDKNSYWQDLEVAARIDAGQGSKTATTMTVRQQDRSIQHDQMLKHKIISQDKEKAENNKEDKEKKISKTGEIKEPFFNDVLQQKAPERQKLSEADVSVENIEVKKTAIQTGNKNASSPVTSKQHKHQHGHELQKPQIPKKFDHLEEERKQQLLKQKLQPREHKANQKELIVSSKPKNNAKSLQKKQPVTALATAAAGKKKTMKHIEPKPSKNLSTSRHHEDRAINETSVHVPHKREKANYMKIYKSQTPQKVGAAVNRRNGTPDDLARSLNHQSPVQQEKKQQNNEKFRSSRGEEKESHTQSEEAKIDITGPNPPEVSTEPFKQEDLLHHESKEFNFSNSGDDECQSLKVSESQIREENESLAEDECQSLEVSKSHTRDTNSNEMSTNIHGVPEDLKHGDRANMSSDDFKLKSQKALQGGYRGILEVNTGNCNNIVPDEHKKIPLAAELLTESEKHLKEKLIKGQLFLNTAEALFKLNIPVSILHGNDHTGQDAETKLILDCGYELLKKKGRRQEFAVHPCKEMSIGYVKVRSFDELIKQLSKDFDMLIFYGGRCSQECDAADYLHKMLEKDIQNGHADVSSMWDFSWNEKTFAFPEKDDLIKDLEKRILNGLLDEITSDLLYIAVSA